MTACVLDTNVIIVANGRNTHADPECQLECVERLQEIRRDRVVIIDDQGLVFKEYMNVGLNLSGIPGVGDAFFKHNFDNMYDEVHVCRVQITPCGDPQCGFEQLPANGLDPSDRKFLALAVVAQAEIVNATDSDWIEQETLTNDLGVKVRQLCPQHARKSP